MRLYERMHLKNVLLGLYGQEDRLADQLMSVRLKRAKVEARLIEEGEPGVIEEANEAFISGAAPVRFLDEEGIERVMI